MLSVADIKGMAFGSIPDSAFDNQPSRIQDLINGAVDSVQTYLNKNLSPTSYTQYTCDSDWERVRDGYKITVARTPVISSDAKIKGKDFLIYDSIQDDITYTAGFETIPQDIKQVIFNLVVYEYNRAAGNTYNFSSKTVVTGSTNAQITKSVEDFYANELAKLGKYVDYGMYSDLVENAE
jgi:hypothetical protein